MWDDAELAQYDAALTRAVAFDRSACGIIEAAGREAPSFLHNLSTNAIADMPLGGGCPAFFCNVRARALFFGGIHRLQEAGRDVFWIDAEPGRAGLLFQHLDKHLIAEQVELSDRSAEFARYHVAGPLVAESLNPLLDKPLPELREYQHTWRRLCGIEVHVRRVEPLGLPGADIVCRAADATSLRDELTAGGLIPASESVWQLLRIEAGTPEFGREYDDNRFVVEVGLMAAVSYEKGCYLGQEPIVMARDRTGFVNRNLRGLRLSVDAAPGDKLFAGAEVGQITSAVYSPGFGPIALGYLRRGHEQPGVQVQVGAADGPPASVVTLPIRAKSS